MMADHTSVGVYNDTACGLFEFINEDEAVQVGYLGWITLDDKYLSEAEFNRNSLYSDLIKNKTDFVMKWPKCDVTYSSKMAKLAQKVEWLDVSARILAYGSWVEMCEQRKLVIKFEETQLTRSTRRARHTLDNDLKTTENNKKVNIKKNCKALFKNKEISNKSSIHIMEQIKDKSATLKKRKMSTESNAGDFLELNTDDDDDYDNNYTKSSKDELHNKIKILNYENRKLRSQISRQQAIIEASNSISDINKVSNEIFSILNKSLNIIKTKKYHHSVKTSNTATSTVTSQKHVKSTPAMTSETIKLPPSNYCQILNTESVTRPSDADTSRNICTDLTNVIELPIDNYLQSHDFGHNDLFDFCVQSAAEAMNDKPTAMVNNPQYLPSQKSVSPKNGSGQLIDKVMMTPELKNDGVNSDFNKLVDLWPGSGVKVHTNKLALVNRKSFAKLVGDLMLMVFTDTELKNGSVSGKKCNFKKSSELFPKEKLDENKTRAIRDFTLSIFPNTSSIEIEKVMRIKLNNYNKKKPGLPVAT